MSVDLSKYRGTFTRTLLIIYYTFFVIQGIFTSISEHYMETQTVLPYLRFFGGTLGLLSTKSDRYFLPIAYLIGTVILILAIVSYTMTFLGTAIYSANQRLLFIIFGILVTGTAFAYQVQTQEQ